MRRRCLKTYYNRAFQHSVCLGDLSQFKCADCHAGKNWTLEGD